MMNTIKAILDVIKQAGLNENSFIFGKGAVNKYSSIHFAPYKDYSKDLSKEYSIQFCNDMLAERGVYAARRTAAARGFDRGLSHLEPHSAGH